MKAKIYYVRGDEKYFCIAQVDATFRDFCERLSKSVGGGGLFVSDDFAFPLKSIHYVEKMED